MILYSPAEIIQAFIVARGLARLPPATATQWPVTVDSMPDQVGNDNYITVYDTGSKPDGRNFHTGDMVDHPTVQVRVRGKTDQLAKEKAAAVQSELLLVSGRAANGLVGPVTVFVLVGVTPSPVTLISAVPTRSILLKQEELNKRRVYVFDVRFTIREG